MAEYIVKFLIYISVLGGIMSALLCAVSQLLCKKLGARWSYIIALAASAAFIVPFVFVGRVQDNHHFTSNMIKNAPRSVNDVVTQKSTIQSGVVTMKKTLPDISTATPAPTPETFAASMQLQAQRVPQKINVYNLILGAYIAVVLVLMLRCVFIRRTFAKSVIHLSDIKDNFNESAQRAADSINYKGRFCIRELRADTSPFVMGIIRPVLYMPENGIITDFSIKHELMHCKRRDLLFKLVADIICIAQFYNPSAYFMRRTLNKMCELSCDEAVTSQMNITQKKDYSMEILALAQLTCPKMTGGAALIERKADLTRRIEGIMEYKKKSFFTRTVSVFTAIVMIIGCTAFAAESTSSAPKLTKTIYTGDFYNVYSNEIDITSNAQVIPEIHEFSMDTLIKNAQCVYSSFLGKTMFYAAWNGMSEESMKRLEEIESSTDENRTNEWGEYLNRDSSFDVFYTVELKKVVRRYGIYDSLEGIFTVTRNGKILYDDVSGYIIKPPSANERNHGESAFLLKLKENDKDYIFYSYINLEDITPEQRKKSLENNFLMGKSILTKEFKLGKVTKLTEYGKECNIDEVNAKYTYDGVFTESGNLTFNKFIPTARVYINTQNYNISLGTNAPIICTDDSISGEFSIITDMYLFETDSVKGTLSGLSGKSGDIVTFKSDDGQWEYSAVLIEPEIPKCHLEGTREVSEFYTEGEEVFIGTPYEQDQYDKIHFGENKKVKRIVVDDNGKVVYVVPVEWQTKPNVIMQPDESYSGTGEWQGVGGSYVVEQDGTIQRRKVLIWDSYNLEAVAVVPVEYQFWKFEK